MGQRDGGGAHSDSQQCSSRGWQHRWQRTRARWHWAECQLPGLPLAHGHKDKQEGHKFKACLDHMVSSRSV